MIFPLAATGVILLPTVVLAGLAGLVLLAARRPQRRFWGVMLWLHLLLLPLHLFVTFPAALGYVGSRVIGTRPQERAYAGPRLAADGSLQIQTWASLAAETRGERKVDAGVAQAAAARAVSIASTGGVVLRAFRLPASQEPPRATVVLVHGLFRSAMELEPPAAMFRRAGCETLLLDLRNPGGSSRAPATFGLRESDDVVAACAFARAQPGRGATPLVVFGVSLGTAAVALALPRIPDVAGVVLDAPMEDLVSAGHRMLAFRRAGDRRNFFELWEPFRSLTLTALGFWSGFRASDVRPAEALASLPASLAVLVVGAGDDDRMPPASVQALYDSLPMATGRKELWIRAGSGHGQVWNDDPAGYERRLRALLQRLPWAPGR
jgi:predicted alpha/beta hydrolase